MRYYIASLKHTNNGHEHIIFWGPGSTGYTPVVGDYIGEYEAAEAAELNDGVDCIAVPVESVKPLLSAEPRFGRDSRFYDQRGSVLDNTRANWNALLKARLDAGRTNDVRPKVRAFRGTRRSYSPSPAV